MSATEIKAAFRCIIRNRVTSSISILGLGIGLGCLIILLALIIHEKSFDNFIPEHRNVYRILFGSSAQVNYPLPENAAREIPGIKDFFRYYQANSLQIRKQGNEIVSENGFGFADSSIFRILGIRFIYGSPARSPREVAISDKVAEKYFGNLSPFGSVISVKFTDGFSDLIVSGVYKSFPSNSTLYPEFIADIKLSEKVLVRFQRDLGAYGSNQISSLDWRYNEFLSYLVLENNTSPDGIAGRMEKYKEFITMDNKDQVHYRLQPVTEIYLGSEGISGGYFLRKGNREELKYYEAISLLILLVSLANYILLTRAGISERMHELGTRKVYGASHGKIRELLLTESGLIVLLSLIPAAFVIDYGIGFINDTLNKSLSGEVFLSPALWIFLIAILLLTGIGSGWLIGLNFSRISALDLIQKNFRKSGRSSVWNYSFLVLHFTIYLILVGGVAIVMKQLNYSRTGYKGINPRNVLVADLNTDELRKSFPVLCDEMEKVPGVLNVAGGSFIPPFGNYLPINLAVATGEKIRFDGLIMGEGMTELLGIDVIDGSSFGPWKEGPPEVLINESAAKVHNVKAGDNILAFRVRGVVRDFHAHSLHTLIQPIVILQQNPERMSLVAIRTDGKNDESVRKRLRELYNQISPDEIFEVRYLTDEVENFYLREKNQARIIGAFTILASILSIMGLFGISLITISKKKKEIGIRKVNGSSVSGVLMMLNLDFIRWVIVSIVISVPAVIYLFSKWMDRFAYKTQISWWIFILTGLSAIIIAILTVSWQSLKAATGNPVKALRYE